MLKKLFQSLTESGCVYGVGLGISQWCLIDVFSHTLMYPPLPFHPHLLPLFLLTSLTTLFHCILLPWAYQPYLLKKSIFRPFSCLANYIIIDFLCYSFFVPFYQILLDLVEGRVLHCRYPQNLLAGHEIWSHKCMWIEPL